MIVRLRFSVMLNRMLLICFLVEVMKLLLAAAAGSIQGGRGWIGAWQRQSLRWKRSRWNRGLQKCRRADDSMERMLKVNGSDHGEEQAIVVGVVVVVPTLLRERVPELDVVLS